MTSVQTSFTSPKQSYSLRFSGDTRLLEPFVMNGMSNKQRLFQDEFYVNRPDVSEEAILEKLLDEKDSCPVLIAGQGRSGKSTLAGHLAKRLQDGGYTVFSYENTIQPQEVYLSLDKLKVLVDQINKLGTQRRVFIFIDEPHVIPVLQAKDSPESASDEGKSILYQLKELLHKNPNIKLVGIMAPEVLNWTERNSSRNQRKLLEDLFPPECHVNIPPIKALPTQNVIDMFDNGLNSAGFQDTPEVIKQKLITLNEPLDIRIMFAVLLALLKMDTTRTNNPATMESISNNIWRDFLPNLQYYLQAMRMN